MVTKTEFRKAVGGLQETTRGLQETVRRLVETMCTKTELQEAVRRLEEKMYTKADHAKFMEWMDEAMTELRDARDERKLSERQVLRIDDIVFDHEKRIRVLEKK